MVTFETARQQFIEAAEAVRNLLEKKLMNGEDVAGLEDRFEQLRLTERAIWDLAFSDDQARGYALHTIRIMPSHIDFVNPSGLLTYVKNISPSK